MKEVQRIVCIPIPGTKKDSGCAYIKRAIAKFTELQSRKQSALIDIGRKQIQAANTQAIFRKKLKDMQEDAEKAVNEVRERANQAAASLTELFDLGRRGLDGQMRAHLENKDWQGEHIDADAFRQCFRMVSQAVKGLGLPSTERENAREAIIDQAAAAIRSTQEAIALAPGQDDGTEH